MKEKRQCEEMLLGPLVLHVCKVGAHQFGTILDKYLIKRERSDN
jgi:hypothetical protein